MEALAIAALYCAAQTYQNPVACIKAPIDEHYTYQWQDWTTDHSARVWAGKRWRGDCSEYAVVLARAVQELGLDARLALYVDPAGEKTENHVYVIADGYLIDAAGFHTNPAKRPQYQISLERFLAEQSIGASERP